VTGGGGFVGRHLLRALGAEPNVQVVNTVAGDLDSWKRANWDLDDVESVGMEVTSSESIRAVLSQVRPDVVYHLAGQASVGESFTNPLQTWEVNATGTLRLVTLLRSESPSTKRMLLISSAEVYGAVPESQQPIPEEAGYRPVTPYGVSKAAAELVAWQLAREGSLELVVARSFNHIGPGQDDRFVLPSMARQLAAVRAGDAEPVLRIGNPHVTRDFLDVRDVVRGYIRLMELGSAGGFYNVCSGVGRSLLQVVTRLIEISGTGAKLEEDSQRVRPFDIPILVGDPSRLRALGWSAQISLDESLRDLLQEADSHKPRTPA
jgi:GDP-4-dehydro-6-deoxy-D-mannose reductase